MVVGFINYYIKNKWLEILFPEFPKRSPENCSKTPMRRRRRRLSVAHAVTHTRHTCYTIVYNADGSSRIRTHIITYSHTHKNNSVNDRRALVCNLRKSFETYIYLDPYIIYIYETREFETVSKTRTRVYTARM